MIQCKYWKKPESITAAMIKEFYGNCNFYIDKHHLHREHITPIYVICEKSSLSYGAKKIFSEYQSSCQVLVLK